MAISKINTIFATYNNNNNILPPFDMTKLSIIVPVYNVEQYIRPCFESIFKQGLDENEYEVIIVNDGSTDKSMEMISDIISQHNNITIINQENQGLSVARNNGIKIAKGYYIFMPDSDDLLIENSLSPLLDQALKTKVDIIAADFIKMEDEEIAHYKHVPQKEITYTEKTGEQLFLEDLNPHQCYVWRSLFRRGFITENNLRFYPGIRYQDVPFTHECYLKAGRCLKTTLLLNIYRRRHGSATFFFRLSKARDFSIAVAQTWKLTYLDGLSPKLLKKLKEDVYISLTMLIYLIAHDDSPFSEKRKVISFLKELAPDISFNDGIKQRLYSLFYQKRPMTLVYFRYLYGIIVDEAIRPTYKSIKNKFSNNNLLKLR